MRREDVEKAREITWAFCLAYGIALIGGLVCLVIRR